jgi:RimJ/RimL family protein N-acetyltransferase
LIETARLLLRHWALDDAAEAASIYGVARAENVASIAVMRKLGMRYLRDGERHGFKSVVYGITASERA